MPEIVLNDEASIRSTRIWNFSFYTYLKARGHTYLILDTIIPTYSGLKVLILSVNLILSWYLTSSSYYFIFGIGGALEVLLPGRLMIGKNVFTIFLNDF